MSAHLHQSDLMILWAEDDADDQFFIKRGLIETQSLCQVVFVSDGEHAWEYLMGSGPFQDRIRFPMPHLLVTDIKMPRCDGLELISRVRKHPNMQALPFFVFTSSDLFSDHEAAQQIGALGFAVKPLALKEWTDCVHTILQHAQQSLTAR
jgi:CheY-like chemotaxis protein